MEGHSRLALAEDLREFADGQLHDAQEGEDAQPGRIGKRLETIGEGKISSHGNKDIKISLYRQFRK